MVIVRLWVYLAETFINLIMDNRAFESGVLTVCAQNKVAPHDAIRLFAKHAALQEDYTLNRALLKIGEAIMREGGYEEDAQMYALMQEMPMMSKYAKAVYIDPVLEVLGVAAQAEADEYIEKGAGIKEWLAKATGLAPDALKLLSAISIAGGAGIGGAYWALNRDSNISDDEVSAKLEQAKYYRSLAKEVNRRARQKGKKMMKQPELVNKPTENMLPANENYYA